jgi:hypothetical protein
MPTYGSVLKDALQASQNIVKTQNTVFTAFDKYVGSAQAMIGSYSKNAAVLTRMANAMNALVEDFGKAAAEISVYEDEYAQAEKDKDKEKMKELAKKMRPLAKIADKARADHGKLVQKHDKLMNDMVATAVKLNQATAKASSLFVGK